MAKTLDEAGVKRLIQEIKGANKNLNTPIPISTDNTPESKAQNVKNIADYVEKAKAAGIANVDGMAITCIIDGSYSGVGYLYGDTDTSICGIEIFDDSTSPMYFKVDPDGTYGEVAILMENNTDIVTSDMLVRGARKPIILTPSTTEVDEETYQKLLSNDVDVVFYDATEVFNILYDRVISETTITLTFVSVTCSDTTDASSYVFSRFPIVIDKAAPHTLQVSGPAENNLEEILIGSGYLNKSILSPILQEIDLTGTDADRKAKLDQFAADWKDLTGASNLNGARFIAKGYFDIPSPPENNVIMTYVENGLVATGYTGIAITTYNSIIGAYRVNIALDGTMSSNVIRDSETTDAFQQFAWAEVPNTYLKIADAASTYETKANVTETLKNYVKGEDAVAIGNIATANAITSIKDDLSPVLQEIDLRGTDAERKAKLDQFETDWKALTGADYLTGARFVGKFSITDDVERNVTGIMTYSAGDAANDATDNCFYGICNGYSFSEQKSQIAVKVSCTDGSLTITPLFSHLEAITIYTDNTPEHMQANLDNIAAYEANLQALGVDTTGSFTIPINNNKYPGTLVKVNGLNRYTGWLNLDNRFYPIVVAADGTYVETLTLTTDGSYSSLTTTSKHIVEAINEINANAVHSDKLVPTLEAITIKTGNTPEDKAANIAAIKAYVDNLTALGVDVTKGYMIPICFSDTELGYVMYHPFSTGSEYTGIVTGPGGASSNIAIGKSGYAYVTTHIQPVESSSLTTTAKSIVPAINEVNALAKSKQDTLISGTNIKTVNGQSLLGSGDIAISGGGGSAPVLVDIDDITGSAGVSVPVDVFNKIANAASAKTPIFGYSKLVNDPRTTYEIIPLCVKHVSTTGTNSSLSIRFIAENAYNSIGIMKSSDTECSISISSSRPFALDTSVDKSSTRGIQSSAVWNEIHSEPMTVNTATSGVTTLSSTDKHKILCYADSGTQQYNLPTSPVDGETFLFLKVKSGHTITIQSGTGNENIYDCSSGNSVVSKTIATSTKSKITVTYSSTVDKWLLMADDFIS